MKKGKKTWIAALLCMLSMTLICGLLYPLVMTVSASLLFPEQANGSQLTVTRNGKTQNVGSALIGQSWTKPEYLIGRPNSGAPTNRSAVSDEQQQAVADSVAWWHAFDPQTRGKDIPEDLGTLPIFRWSALPVYERYHNRVFARLSTNTPQAKPSDFWERNASMC